MHDNTESTYLPLLRCPLCESAVPDTEKLDGQALRALFYQRSLLAVLHDISGDMNGVDLAVTMLKRAEPDTAEQAERVADFRRRMKEMALLVRHLQRLAHPQRYLPWGASLAENLQSLHDELNRIYRLESSVDTSQLDGISLCIEPGEYYCFLSGILQEILVAICRARQTQVRIRYATKGNALVGLAELGLDAGVDVDRARWNVAELVAEKHRAMIGLRRDDDALVIRWIFPFC
jgi:hypothetical protein